MKLTHEFDVRVEVGDAALVGPGPLGMRLVGPIAGGTFEGERLKGSVLAIGADWLLVGPDGWGRIDVRAHLVTHDGAGIYVSYGGVIEMTDEVQRALMSDDGTEYSDQYWRTTPRLETGDLATPG